jgi:hypothetical protein
VTQKDVFIDWPTGCAARHLTGDYDMPMFELSSSAGVILGTYRTATVQEAKDVLARDAGYRDYAEVKRVTGESDASWGRDNLIVTQIMGT